MSITPVLTILASGCKSFERRREILPTPQQARREAKVARNPEPTLLAELAGTHLAICRPLLRMKEDVTLE
jgi:hypothetical protein